MFPFWHDVVAPVLEAAGARRIVEVGALRGENTELMLHRLPADAELHVIDPLPEFDPAEHERRFAGRYVFHRDLSVNVLPHLPPMDAALIDGDHNWYTVFTELNQLAEVSRAAGAPLPVLILHDVGWPYGRRDLYYNPDTIPEEHRQPWRRAPMRPGRSELLDSGYGLNPDLANAEHEGGPRNGVMTAVEDFIAGYDKPLRLVYIPIYFGLAIVVEEERLARQPALAAELDRLESNEGKDALLRLSEQIRIDAAIFDQALVAQRDRRVEQLAARYLETVKRGIVNDLHLELELRLAAFTFSAERGTRPSPEVLRDPVRHATGWLERVQRRHETGEAITLQPDVPPEQRFPDEGLTRQGYATTGKAGLDHLHECLDAAWSVHALGDLVVCGVGHGGPAIFAAAYLQARDLEPRAGLQRKLWVLDRFRADGGGADLNQAREALARFDLLDRRVKLLAGDPAATAADVAAEHLTLLHLGPRLAADDARAVLEQLYPKLSTGGVVVVEDADDAELVGAVEAYRAAHGISTATERAGRGLHWVKVEPHGQPEPGRVVAPPAAGRAPLAPRLGYVQPDLSVVVVFHDMRREAERTLHSLSRRYQRDLDGLRYEVVVVENGSSPDQRLGEEFVERFGREFRYLDLGDESAPTPAVALNRGIEASKGRHLALMIDGAHVLTPRVLHYGMLGLRTFAPAVVATQPWYVGPGQQGDVMRFGYDRAAEDELFARIGWPEDGYRLFEIGHFVGDRDWFDGVWESNCLFVAREVLEQVGGCDEAFTMAGGGYTNLDLYERLASQPDTRIVTILGEGSFHQLHGGTTTNLPDPVERRERIRSYADHYAELRGKPFMGPEKPIHFVGGFAVPAALRCRSRRLTATVFDVDLDREGIDGPATEPAIPVPDDLKAGFTNAYYRSLAWKETRWLGRRVENAPTDLFTYQELVTEVRPDWIIETGSRSGGRALLFASVCDALGHGQVVSIAEREADRPKHPRITYVIGQAHDPATVEQVRSIVGPEPRALVVLGSRTNRDRTRREFDAYAPFVPVGSYVVIEHTALNGFPIDGTFGPGPHEAVRRILNVHGEFLADTEREKHSLTFNPGGYLRRIS